MTLSNPTPSSADRQEGERTCPRCDGDGDGEERNRQGNTFGLECQQCYGVGSLPATGAPGEEKL